MFREGNDLSRYPDDHLDCDCEECRPRAFYVTQLFKDALWLVAVIVAVLILAWWLLNLVASPVHAAPYERSFSGERASAHFYVDEFRCKGDGKVIIHPQLTAHLERLRASLGGKEIIITSGYRSPAYNKKVGGAARSQHMLGRAADIRIKGMSPRDVAIAAKMVGFTYVKVYKGWTHVDVRGL